MSETDTLVAGRYRLLERIATGGMGVVWRGWDERLRRVVAVKELLVHPGLGDAAAEHAAHRAMREARITARLQHPNAIPVYDVVEHEGRPCLIMEYLPSRSLQNLITERGMLTVEEVSAIGSQIAAALAAAHRAGIVHRDVKPANVLLASEGTAKLTDFGISRAFGDVTATTSGMVTGTPAYLAPEVATGNPGDFPSDVFSFGSTLYAALEGHPPFGTHGNPIAILHRVAAGNVVPPRRSGRLTPLINDMLQFDPPRRPTIFQVERALAEAAAGKVAPVASHLLATPSLQTDQFTVPSIAPTTAPSPTRQLPTSGRTAPPPQQLPQPRTGQTHHDGRRRGLLIGVLVATALVLTGVIFALVTTRRSGLTATGPSAAALRSASGSAATLHAAPTSGGAGGSSARTTAAAVPPPATTFPAPPATSVAETVASPRAQAITSYYALLPTDESSAWARLTDTYQQRSGGFAGYQQFWNTVAQVTASDVTVEDDGSVQATITYVYKNGEVIDEPTSFGLVDNAGVLKIDSSSVLRSHTR